MKRKIKKSEEKLSSEEIEQIRRDLNEARKAVNKLSDKEFKRGCLALHQKRFDAVPPVMQNWLGLAAMLCAVDPKAREFFNDIPKPQVEAMIKRIKKPKKAKRNARYDR
jgi:hypothetical protein